MKDNECVLHRTLDSTKTCFAMDSSLECLKQQLREAGAKGLQGTLQVLQVVGPYLPFGGDLVAALLTTALGNWAAKAQTDRKLERLADGCKGVLYAILEKLVDQGSSKKCQLKVGLPPTAEEVYRNSMECLKEVLEAIIAYQEKRANQSNVTKWLKASKAQRTIEDLEKDLIHARDYVVLMISMSLEAKVDKIDEKMDKVVAQVNKMMPQWVDELEQQAVKEDWPETEKCFKMLSMCSERHASKQAAQPVANKHQPKYPFIPPVQTQKHIAHMPTAPPLQVRNDSAFVTPVNSASGSRNGRARAQRLVDLLFIVDATGSMRKALETCKQQIMEVVGSIATTTGFGMRVGLAAYRDFDVEDALQKQTIPFTIDIEEFQSKLGSIKAIGSKKADIAEDVFTGIECATKSDEVGKWQSDVRLIMHFADAPAHGLRFHNNVLWDKHPKGDPKDRDLKAMFRSLAHLNEVSQYVFVHLNDSTKMMVQAFKEDCDDDWLMDVTTHNIELDFTKLVVNSVSSSINDWSSSNGNRR